jgi:hypothetical protein
MGEMAPTRGAISRVPSPLASSFFLDIPFFHALHLHVVDLVYQLKQLWL